MRQEKQELQQKIIDDWQNNMKVVQGITQKDSEMQEKINEARNVADRKKQEAEAAVEPKINIINRLLKSIDDSSSDDSSSDKGFVRKEKQRIEQKVRQQQQTLGDWKRGATKNPLYLNAEQEISKSLLKF